MSDVRPFFLGRLHPYTSADVPWRMDVAGSPLFRYLRGGGVKGLGGSSEEAVRTRRQTRFLVCFALLAVAWCVLWIV